jgi:acetyltransferase-like isoleucine patch superfamily enzyme/glycosyltransferase involved in cell wall biosynthesis
MELSDPHPGPLAEALPAGVGARGDDVRLIASSTAAETPAPENAGGPPVSVVILTFNEGVNIADCLRSCAWSDDVHVVDSGSTDRTVEIARSMGAQVHTHPFTSFGDQRNWAIDQIAHKYLWVFHLDADERFTPELVAEMGQVLAAEPAEAGFYVPHKMIFMGRWLRHAEGGYPIYQMRLFHRGRMRFRDWGHGQRENTAGIVGLLTRPYLHYNFSKGLEEWIDKHNRYSTLEARQVLEGQQSATGIDSPFGNAVQRRRYFKSRVYPKLPGKWLGRFLWMYVLRGGFLDGLAGLQYCLLVSTYELFISLKLAELRRAAMGQQEAAVTAPVIAPPAGAKPRLTDNGTIPSQREASNGHGPAPATPRHSPSDRVARATDPAGEITHEKSPWPLREKVGRVLWMGVQATLFRRSFHNWYGWRSLLLRSFGAEIGKNVRIRPTARIEVPWHLHIGDHCAVGDHAILYSLGPIHIGRLATISQYAHLCAGTHDYTDPSFPLIRPPIYIGDEAWVAADAFVGPGVTVGDRAIIGARATVVKDVPPGVIVGGNPARIIKPRALSVARQH